MVKQGILLLASFALLGCPRRTEVWIVEGSTAENLVFGIGVHPGKERSIPFYSLVIAECNEHHSAVPAVWSMQPIVGTEVAQYPSQVRYGASLDGFRQEGDSSGLPPGCYEASIGGSGRVVFSIDSVGAITVRK